MFESGREGLPYVRKWSAGPLRCPREVWRLSRMSEVIRGPSWMSSSGRKSLPNVGSGRMSLLDVQEWSGDVPKCP